MALVRFDPSAAPPPSNAGWDAWADEYATLGAISPVYALGKELLHGIVDEILPARPGRRVLDVHCGAGDDLERFLARGWRAVGCDGSPGMLRAAAARCPAELGDGRLELWLGRGEELEPGTFGDQRFDLVYSTTGGFTYLDDESFVRVHRALAGKLVPGGVMVVAHLGPFCAAESLYHLLRLRPRRAIQRWRGEVPIEVRGERLLMRLRSPARLRRLLGGVVELERVAPLLVCTPPFQTGFVPGPRTLAVLRALEEQALGSRSLAWLADQVVCVSRPLRS